MSGDYGVTALRQYNTITSQYAQYNTIRQSYGTVTVSSSCTVVRQSDIRRTSHNTSIPERASMSGSGDDQIYGRFTGFGSVVGVGDSVGTASQYNTIQIRQQYSTIGEAATIRSQCRRRSASSCRLRDRFCTGFVTRVRYVQLYGSRSQFGVRYGSVRYVRFRYSLFSLRYGFVRYGYSYRVRYGGDSYRVRSSYATVSQLSDVRCTSRYPATGRVMGARRTVDRMYGTVRFQMSRTGTGRG